MPTLPKHLEPLALLGRGSMGEVWRVRQAADGQELALKLCLAPDEPGRLLFRQEHWAMSTLRHPALVEALEYGETPDQVPYFTMPVVEGRDAEPGMSEEAVFALLPSLASALDFLHGRGFVHGDLKPENIRLLPDGTARLMDLGLLRRSGRPGPIAGTLLYLAPEIALGRPVDGRTDLYMLGAVLFELVAGRPPFRAERPEQLLRAHVETPAPRLRELGVAVSVELDTAISYLLAKDPAARFPSGQALLAALGLEAADDAASVPWGPPLVGREGLQARLEAWLQEPHPAATTFAFTGASGTGRTRLLEETHASARLGGRRSVLAGGLGVDAPPYAALAPWLRTLWAEAEPGARDWLGPLLAAGLPELGGRAAAALDAAAERARFFDAVATLADTAGEGCLFCLDDVERLDADSVALLEYLRSRGQGKGWRWLFTGQDLPERFRASALQEALGPLGEIDALLLASAMLGGEVPEAVSERLRVFTEGVPGRMVTLIQRWAQSGALLRRAGQWVAPDADALALPPGEQALADWSLDGLSPQALGLASQAALLGERGALTALVALSALPGPAFFAAVAELESADVIVSDGSAYRFVRPALAVRLEAALPAAERTEGHRAVAAQLVREEGLEVRLAGRDLAGLLAVARHLLAAGDAAEAWPWVEAGAKLCVASGTMLAVAPLVQALGGASDLPPAAGDGLAGLEVYMLRHEGAIDQAIDRYENGLLQRFRNLGAALASEHLVTFASLKQQKGEYEQAVQALEEGLGLARGAGLWATAVRAEFFLGRIAYFGGDARKALAHIDGAIEAGRANRLASMLPPILSLAGFILATEYPDNRPRAFRMMREAIELASEDGNLYDTADAQSNLGNALMAVGDFAAAHTSFLEYLALCERLALPTEATFAHLNLAAAALELGRIRLAKRHADQALAIARPQGRRFPEGFALAIGGLLTVLLGQPVEGLDGIRAGLALAREIKNKYLASQILALQAEGLLMTGQLAEAAAVVAERQAGAEASDHDEQAARMARVQAALEATLRPEAWLDAQAGERPAEAGVSAHQAYWAGAAALRLGRLELAEAHLARAAEGAEAEGLRHLTGEVALLRALVAEQGGRRAEAARLAGLAWDVAQAVEVFTLGPLARGLSSRLPGGDPTAAREARNQLAGWQARLPEAGRAQALTMACRDLVLASDVAESSGDEDLAGWLVRLTAQPSLEGLSQETLHAVMALFAPESVYLVTFEGDQLTGMVGHSSSGGQSDDFVATFAQAVAAAGEERQAEQHTVPGQPPRRLVGVPAGPGGRWVLVLRFGAEQGVPGSRRLASLGVLGQQAGLLLGLRQRLERAAVEAAAGQAGLAAALRLLEVTDPAERLRALAAEALAVTGAERLLWLRQPEGGGRLTCDGAFGPGGFPLADEWQMYTKGVTRHAVAQRKATFVCDVQQEEDFRDRGSVRALGMRSVFVVPVLKGDTLLGVLYLDQQHMVPGSDAALAKLEAIAAVLAQAAVNAPSPTP